MSVKTEGVAQIPYSPFMSTSSFTLHSSPAASFGRKALQLDST